LNEQNQALRDQLSELNNQIDNLALNLKMYDKQRQTEIEHNKCNHDIVINQLDTMLKGRHIIFNLFKHGKKSTLASCTYSKLKMQTKKKRSKLNILS